jgi:predicted nucleic acid-binding protein
MILVDSSVWIDYFNGNTTLASEKLDSLLGVRPICTGDLILTEVLQGFKSDSDFTTAKSLLCGLPVHNMLGYEISLKALITSGCYVKKALPSEKQLTS